MKYLLLTALIASSSYASDLKLVGKSLVEYSIFKFDVYEIAFYKNDKGLEELRLDYKTDVKKKHSVSGWKKTTQHLITKKPELASKLQWLIDNTIDYAKADKVVLRRNNDKVSLIHNNKVVASKTDKETASILFEPWLGSQPFDEEVRNELLGI